MLKIVSKLLFFSILGSVLIARALVGDYSSVCASPLKYSVGSVDERFGLSKGDFLKSVQNAELVWEDVFGTQLLEYQEEATFKVNMIFDERQERTIEQRKLEEKREELEKAKEGINTSYEKLKTEHERALAQYEQQKVAFEKELDDYNDAVKDFNRNPTSESDYEKLKDKEEEMKKEGEKLEVKRAEVNRLVDGMNELAKKDERITLDYNSKVETFGDKYGGAKEFHQGTYFGDRIDVFQYYDEKDLHMVLVHEFGHALGLDHLDDPRAIMYYLRNEQNIDDLKLTGPDIGALENVCRNGY